MKKYEHLKEKAIEWRKRGLTFGEIQDRLKISKSTLHYWIGHIKRENAHIRTKKQQKAQLLAAQATKKKYAILRENAYNKGKLEASLLLSDLKYRDFTMLYLTEGWRKTQNDVSICNSNWKLVKLGYDIIKKHANINNCMIFSLQCHEDNDENKLKEYWAEKINITPNQIKVIRKSNSGQLSGRKWRSLYGVFTVRACDTYLRQRIEAWMDYIQDSW